MNFLPSPIEVQAGSVQRSHVPPSVHLFNREKRSTQNEKQHRQREEEKQAMKLKTMKQQSLQLERNYRTQGTVTLTAALPMVLLPSKKAWSFWSQGLGHTNGQCESTTCTITAIHPEKRPKHYCNPCQISEHLERSKASINSAVGEASFGTFTLLDNRKVHRKLIFFNFMAHRTINSGLQKLFYELDQVTFRNSFQTVLFSSSRK